MGGSVTTGKQVRVLRSRFEYFVRNPRRVRAKHRPLQQRGTFVHVLPSVTVQCTRDGQFVVVVAQDATDPRVDVNSISLLKLDGPSCTPVDFTDVFAIFQFPVTACGTTMKEVGALQSGCFAKKPFLLHQI